MRLPTCAIIAAAVLLNAAPAQAASDADWQQCSDVDNVAAADQNIAACTRILADPQEAAAARVTALANRCYLNFTKDGSDRGVPDCDEAIRLNPKDPFAYDYRGLIRYRKGNYDSAIADFSEEIRIDPTYAYAYYNRGMALNDKGELDRAMADIEQFIRLDAKNPFAHDLRGVILEKKGDHDAAIAEFNEEIRLDPTIAGAYTNRGFSRYGKGDDDGATADYAEAIQRNPQDVNAHKFRGYIEYQHGDFATSAADFQRAYELVVDAYPALWRYLARARLGQDGASELSSNAERLPSKAWPFAVIEFYLGRHSLEAMRAAAGNADEKCEAAYYDGEWQLLKDNKSAAKSALQIAADTCPKNFFEVRAAAADLKRLAP